VIPETKRVPVDRLVANLERQLAADPKDIQTRINLARLHGMAYALKTEEVIAARWPPKAREEPYYGHNSDLIPYKPVKASTPAADAAARGHLEKAVSHYEAALALDPRNLLARLGYGWMLQQAGERSRAMAEYRQVIRDAWVTEEHTLRMFPEDRYFTHEAAGYLISLLDPARDADEIADLQAKRNLLAAKPARAITPLAVPLEPGVPADGIPAPHARVAFDADGSGLRRHWTWISPRTGWLVHDSEQLGRITSALQWFGSVSFWLFWENGYQALAALDDDGNGEVAGEELRDLAIWHDRNSDGVSDPGEVRPLAAHRIVGLSCRYIEGDGVAFAALSPEGVKLADGSTRPSYDVLLRAVDARMLTRR
jgi:tetratricopeptide (TPR) repeat protein